MKKFQSGLSDLYLSINEQEFEEISDTSIEYRFNLLEVELKEDIPEAVEEIGAQITQIKQKQEETHTKVSRR